MRTLERRQTPQCPYMLLPKFHKLPNNNYDQIVLLLRLLAFLVLIIHQALALRRQLRLSFEGLLSSVSQALFPQVQLVAPSVQQNHSEVY